MAWVVLILVLWIVPGRTAKAEEAVFVVVEHPANLFIYNRYQQILSAQDRSALVPFEPIRVIDALAVLGDGITPCMKVEMHGDVHYVLLEAEGRLAGEAHAGVIKSYPGAHPLADTILVMQNGSLRFEPAGSTAATFLHAGERLTQIFRYGSKTFVHRQTSPNVYGWVNLRNSDENRLWRTVVEVTAGRSAITGRIRDSVASRVARVNSILAGLFNYFNRTTPHPRPIPRWTAEASDSTITCTIEAVNSPDFYRESTHYFARELENVVLGSGLEVSSSSGKIVIRPK
jgi:hypothetical protein